MTLIHFNPHNHSYTLCPFHPILAFFEALFAINAGVFAINDMACQDQEIGPSLSLNNTHKHRRNLTRKYQMTSLAFEGGESLLLSEEQKQQS